MGCRLNDADDDDDSDEDVDEDDDNNGDIDDSSMLYIGGWALYW